MLERIAEAAVSSDPFVVLFPVFNDWHALGQLLLHLDCVLAERGLETNVLLIDDGSTASAEEAFPCSFVAFRRVEVLRLRRNLGHQRAIAIGLAYIADKVPCQAVILMDSDGEDDPRDVPRLLEKYYEEAGQKIIFAERTKRSESWVFRIFYALYRVMHLLTYERARACGQFQCHPGLPSRLPGSRL